MIPSVVYDVLHPPKIYLKPPLRTVLFLIDGVLADYAALPICFNSLYCSTKQIKYLALKIKFE